MAVYIEDGSNLNNASLANLRHLNFAGNKLRIIPKYLFEFFKESLKILDLSNNPITLIAENAFKNLKLEKM